MIDWTKPIEAVNISTGVVKCAVAEDWDGPGDPTVGVRIDNDFYIHVSTDGVTHQGPTDRKAWTIRNRAEPANDELAELRAFKEAAIKRFPELAEPETDEAAADRFEEEYWHDRINKPRDLALAAIAWARANPR